MAQYEHLPIYRKASDLAARLERTVHGFSRRRKCGPGVRLRHSARDVRGRGGPADAIRLGFPVAACDRLPAIMYSRLAHLARAAPGVLFPRVGSRFELLGGCARKLAARLGLREIAPRPGLRRRAGFHRRHPDRFVERAVRLGLPVTVVEQQSWVGRTTGQRRIAVRLPSCHPSSDGKEHGA